MKSKKFVRIVAIVLAAIMVFSVLYAAVSSISASAVTQAQIDKLRADKKEIDKKKQEMQSKINTLEYDQMSAVAKKEVLDDRIALMEQDIANINELIASYVMLIEEKEAEVIIAQRQEDEQLAQYKKRVRNMEEHGAVSYLAVIFDAESFSDMLAKIDMVGAIMQDDENTYNRLINARLATISAKEALEQTKIEQEAEKAELLIKVDELNAQVEQSIEMINQIMSDLDAAKTINDEIDAEMAKIQKEINTKVEELKKQQAAAAAAAVSGGTGTGSLIWPAPASGLVTSKYGNRYHPTYKVYKMHTGIDIGAGYGASVIAADGGTVITSTYNSAYGNYVVVSHGGGMTTLYAHMSSRKVSVGATVKKGDLVGLVGSTGVSTGPHLHFEVSINGSRVNPLNYFSNYTLSSGA